MKNEQEIAGMCRTSIPEQDICQEVDAISPTPPQRTLQSIKKNIEKRAGKKCLRKDGKKQGCEQAGGEFPAFFFSPFFDTIRLSLVFRSRPEVIFPVITNAGGIT
ncbi:MAG: hypothetical protein HPY58_09230 [Firmicutes bacterium]|nr:hypothetical protein [Bacillota bacterium]